MRIQTLLLSLAVPFILASCKKSQPDAVAAQPVATNIAPLADNVLKDSVLLLTKDIYLWNTQVPSTFNAQRYDDPNKMMEGIRAYSMEPGFAQPVDRFSFAMKKTAWDNISAGMSLLGTTVSANGDVGLTVFFKAEGDLRVRLAEPNSPAGLAGIHRGWRITKINGNSNITTSNSNFIVDNIYNAANVSLVFQKPDGSLVTIDVIQAHYAIKPVYLDTVYTINNKKIGYLVFNSFLGKVNQQYGDFQRVFSRFAGEGVTDLVIDLRYNGGGFVSVQEKLANYLVNSTADGAMMMKEEYNANNNGSNTTIQFKKEGALNMNRIYFIVGRATASASELLINNLKPYMDVRLIGSSTYGKPVGFYPIPVADWYIFPVSFRITNKNGEGNYFNGIPVNSAVADGLDRDWGDLNETCLASAIRNITTGLFSKQSQQEYIEPAMVAKGNQILEEPLLKVTIGER